MRIEGLSTFGEEVKIDDELLIKNSSVFPNVNVVRSLEGETVMF